MRSRKSTRKIKTQIIETPMLEHQPQQSESFFNIYGMKLNKHTNDIITEQNKPYAKSPPNNSVVQNSQKPIPPFLLRKQKSPTAFKSVKSDKNISLNARFDYNNAEQIQWKDVIQKLQPNKHIESNEQRQLINKPLFRKLLKEYIDKYEQCKFEIETLNEKLIKYQNYFEKIKLNTFELPDNDSNSHHNLSLKCLLQQQKITSLMYVIRQYRSRNRQQSIKFQKMLSEYQPNLENELTVKLADSNSKLEALKLELNEIRDLFGFYRQQGPKYDWRQLLEELNSVRLENKNQKANNLTLKNQVEKLNQSMVTQKSLLDNVHDIKEQLRKQRQMSMVISDRLQWYQEQTKQMEKEQEQNRIKLQNLQATNAENSMLKSKLQDKTRALTQATSLIGKIQTQNIIYKTKLDMLTQDFQKKVFQEKTLIDKLNLLSNSAIETKNRLIDALKFSAVTEKLNGDLQLKELLNEKGTFIKHLFDKNQTLYSDIINQFKTQLNVLYNDAESSSKMAQKLSVELRQRQCADQLMRQEINIAKQRLLKYQRQIDKITVKNCIVCNQLKGYCHQLNSILTKLINTI